jgi:hypothetical protein
MGRGLTALVIAGLDRGTAIPVAWVTRPGNPKGPGLEPLLGLLDRLHAARPVTERWTVRVLADRGLWRPRLWCGIRQRDGHPVWRVQQTITLAPAGGGQRGPACRLLRQGQAWVGRGGLRAPEPKLTVTLIAVWTPDQKAPWVLVTDLAPERVGIAWYALRMSIERGFRRLKSVGWQGQQIRCRDPRRAPLADPGGGHVVDAGLRHPCRGGRGDRPAARACAGRRHAAATGRAGHASSASFAVASRGRLWRCLWLIPDPWPQPPDNLQIIRRGAPS